jgi:hypothetical protein
MWLQAHDAGADVLHALERNWQRLGSGALMRMV